MNIEVDKIFYKKVITELSEKDIKAPKFCDSDVRFFYERAESLK